MLKQHIFVSKSCYHSLHTKARTDDANPTLAAALPCYLGDDQNAARLKLIGLTTWNNFEHV